MVKKGKTSKRNNKKTNKKRTKRYKGGAILYNEVGDEGRDSVDEQAEGLWREIGIANVKEGSQIGWLSIGISGIIGVGAIAYLLIKKR